MCFEKILGKKIEDPEPEPPSDTQVPGMERPSPAGVISFSDLSLSRDRGTLTVKKSGMIFSALKDTNSMDPLFDTRHTLIMTEDFEKNNLIVGDIVSYHAGSGRYIVHRIQEITQDSEGRLYTLLGDNNAGQRDSFLVRNEHIKYLVVGIIYTNDFIPVV